jgi:hypothetical protein
MVDVRGICRGDRDGSYVVNLAGDTVILPEGATDATVAPYHMARSKLFVRERTVKTLIHLDTPEIEAAEALIFDTRTSTGVSDDLQRATKVATKWSRAMAWPRR